MILSGLFSSVQPAAKMPARFARYVSTMGRIGRWPLLSPAGVRRETRTGRAFRRAVTSNYNPASTRTLLNRFVIRPAVLRRGPSSGEARSIRRDSIGRFGEVFRNAQVNLQNDLRQGGDIAHGRGNAPRPACSEGSRKPGDKPTARSLFT